MTCLLADDLLAGNLGVLLGIIVLPVWLVVFYLYHCEGNHGCHTARRNTYSTGETTLKLAVSSREVAHSLNLVMVIYPGSLLNWMDWLPG